MWFSKQGAALAYHDAHPTHIVIAKDISSHGHKRYGVFPRANVNIFQGPYNELIRTNSVCRLYFDLDGPGLAALEGSRQVSLLVDQVREKLEPYQVDLRVLVLCSSTVQKFSKHIIFPNVHFRDNWQHMRSFVAMINHSLVDQSVYSRNRCFRMAGCCKYGDPTRIFRPGQPADALIQVCGPVIPYMAPVAPRAAGQGKGGGGKGGAGGGGGTFNIDMLNVPDGWPTTLQSFEPDDLLKAIHPDQAYAAFFAIGCAYKRVGGSSDVFCDWCSRFRRAAGVLRQWRGWHRPRGYGLPFLKMLALHSSKTEEHTVRLNEAFGFHPGSYGVRVHHFNSTYLDYKHIFPPKKKAVRCTLVKSRTGSGKSTIARLLAQRYANKRILYLVSSRSLAYAAKASLNAMTALGHKLNFVAYLETDKPLWKYEHLVLSIQSLWRAYKLHRQPYHLIICDELSSIIEDMTNVTNKHPRENQMALRWFSERCKRWVGLDAHLMDTGLVLTTEYFKDVTVFINHASGDHKDAIFIPVPKWTTLNKTRIKACAPGAPAADVDAFSDATCMYDLMFKCWASGVKTFLVCNNVRLGDFIEENFLRRSFTWIALLCAGFCNDVATLVTDFACKKGDNVVKLLSYAWIKKGDGRTGADFRTLDWWSKIDHLQYTLKICQGIDFNPVIPHFGVGFCYTTPNTAVPRRVLQQAGRIRKYAPSHHKRPTVYFAVGNKVVVGHLKVCGFKEIAEYAARQEYFMKAVVKHHGTTNGSYFEYLFEPEPVWRRLYLMVINERETFLKYPTESFEWWLKHDDWTLSAFRPKPLSVVRWQRSIFRVPVTVQYDDIADITTPEFEWLDRRRNKTAQQTLQVSKYRFKQTFKRSGSTVVWDLWNEHRSWIANTLIERFEDFESVITRRFGKLWQTQRSGEWLDMTAARLVIVNKIAKKLGLLQLWSSNGAVVSPGCYNKATTFTSQNKEQIKLAFQSADTVKAILLAWGGHKLKIHKRVRKRVQGVRVDESVRVIESPPWELLRLPF